MRLLNGIKRPLIFLSPIFVLLQVFVNVRLLSLPTDRQAEPRPGPAWGPVWTTRLNWPLWKLAGAASAFVEHGVYTWTLNFRKPPSGFAVLGFGFVWNKKIWKEECSLISPIIHSYNIQFTKKNVRILRISLFLCALFKLCIYLWTRGHTNNFNSSLESIKPPNSDGWHVSCRLISSQTDQEKLRPDLRCLSGFCCLLNFTIVDVSCEERVFLWFAF